MKSWIRQAACAAAAVIASAGAQANLVTNGDFDAGTLAGWTTYLTGNGDLPLSTITSFDVTGAGSSQAATLRAGVLVTNFPAATPRAGGGLSQQFSTAGGTVSFSADVAAFRSATVGFNADGGLFELVVDGIVLDAVDFGSISLGAERGALAATTVLTAGLHELRLQLTRSFTPATDVFGYFDNVVVSDASTVPEPGSLALVLLAIGGAVASRRKPA